MTIYILMPVFNQLDKTVTALECIQNQKIDHEICTIVIDDGSTDGTSRYLQHNPSVKVLQGDGSLWWGGSIELGLQDALKKSSTDDWILFLNNDTLFESDFIRSLLETAVAFKPAAVGSVICDINHPNRIISIGPMINSWNFQIWDKLNDYINNYPESNYYHVDALSGRGTIYPVAAFQRCGTMRPHLLPHYFADYELSLRVKKSGYKLLVSGNARTLSLDEYGNSTYFPLSTRFISKKSSLYIPAVLSFWYTASTNAFQFITVLPRLLLRFFYQCLLNK